jgi:hypothetical protein
VRICSLNSPEVEALIMPQIFSIGAYIIFIWVNEGKPVEPIHVHVAEKRPTQNAL